MVELGQYKDEFEEVELYVFNTIWSSNGHKEIIMPQMGTLDLEKLKKDGTKLLQILHFAEPNFTIFIHFSK